MLAACGRAVRCGDLGCVEARLSREPVARGGVALRMRARAWCESDWRTR
jgi:hypothetical protein